MQTPLPVRARDPPTDVIGPAVNQPRYPPPAVNHPVSPPPLTVNHPGSLPSLLSITLVPTTFNCQSPYALPTSCFQLSITRLLITQFFSQNKKYS